jgi:hypothetical protein
MRAQGFEPWTYGLKVDTAPIDSQQPDSYDTNRAGKQGVSIVGLLVDDRPIPAPLRVLLNIFTTVRLMHRVCDRNYLISESFVA